MMVWRLLGLNALVSAGVGMVLGLLLGGLFQIAHSGILVTFLVFIASSLTMVLWLRFRRTARWHYLEGLAWALLVFVLAAVPCLLILFGSNDSWGDSLLEALLMALVLSSPILLVAAFVPLGWKRILERQP